MHIHAQLYFVKTFLIQDIVQLVVLAVVAPLRQL